jgi:hypothetical protein
MHGIRLVRFILEKKLLSSSSSIVSEHSIPNPKIMGSNLTAVEEENAKMEKNVNKTT